MAEMAEKPDSVSIRTMTYSNRSGYAPIKSQYRLYIALVMGKTFSVVDF